MLNRYIPFVGTVVFHAVVALLLVMGMRSCEHIQKKEEIKYEELSLAALGDFEPGEGEYVDLGAETQAVEAAGGDVQEIIDQATSTAEVVSGQSTEATTQTVPNPEAEAQAKTEAENAAKKSKINNLFTKPGSNSSAGTTPGGTGIEGNPNGSPDGEGTFGDGKRGGGKWGLKGRGMKAEPRLDEKPQYEGSIFVRILVDREGNVIDAKADPIQSKVAGEGFSQLKTLAEKAARSAKFSVNAEATIKQQGYMIINFKFKN